jgi:diaminohydroxyphosphoribosylaminopyrimidine deaminase/5-amino-6-(5-phosphoribosylamino)uracil reductase
VTLEPCSHHGRTPPCAELLAAAGVARVVSAVEDPNPLVSGSGISLLRSRGIQVDVGLMKGDAEDLIEAFACHVTSGRPLVVGKVGMSLDGRIAASGGEDQRISSPEAHDFTHQLRLSLDALLVGVGTILADDPLLSYRGPQVKSRQLIRVVLDAALRTPPEARIFRADPPGAILIFCAAGASLRRRKRLEQSGAETIVIPSRAGLLDLDAVLDELGRRDILGMLVEGGAETHWSFISHRLVDKFYFVMAPFVIGGKRSISAVEGEGYRTASLAPRFRIRRTFPLGADFVLETYPCYSRSILSPWRLDGRLPFDGQGSSPSSVRK